VPGVLTQATWPEVHTGSLAIVPVGSIEQHGDVVFVDGHGGNLDALGSVVSQLRAEGREVVWLPCATPDIGGRLDAHAGYTETSLMIHLLRGGLLTEHAEAGNDTPIARLLPQLHRDGVAAVSANGVLGDPTDATATEGAPLLEAMAAEAAASVLAWRADDTGRLIPGLGSGG
jgi:mycofactocin precursor peptide peptidase